MSIDGVPLSSQVQLPPQVSSFLFLGEAVQPIADRLRRSEEGAEGPRGDDPWAGRDDQGETLGPFGRGRGMGG